VWSDHTGERRLVRVRYTPRNRFLRPLGPVAAQARLMWAIPTVILWSVAAAILLARDTMPAALRYPLLVVAGILAGRAAYRLVSSAIDLLFPLRVTGTVVDIGVAARNPTADHAEQATFPMGDFTTFYSFVVDDGSTDVLRPWLVSRGVAGDVHPARAADPGKAMSGDAGGFRVGDLVTIEGQRFSRYARRLVAAPPRSIDA